MRYNEDELRDMVLRYRRGEDVRCNCGGVLRVNDVPATRRTKTTPTEFACGLCGRSGFITPNPAKDRWTESEIAHLRERYWTDGAVRCPGDGGLLKITEVPSRRGRGLIGRCEYCGNRF